MPAVAFDRFAAELLSLYEPPLRQPATYRQMRQVLHEFAAVPGVKRTSDLTAPNVAAYIKAHPQRSAARTASMLRCLSIAAKYAVKPGGYLRFSPFDWRSASEWVRSDVVISAKPRPILHRSGQEVGNLLALLDSEAAGGGWQAGRLQALAYLYAYTAMRKVEGLSLLRSDVDLAAGVISIQPKPHWRPKTVQSAAKLPIAAPLAAVLCLWLPRTGAEWVFPGTKLRGPWIHGAPGYKALDQLKAAGLRAGIKDLTILGLRKTVATLAPGQGITELERMALLRHTNPRTAREFYDEKEVEALRSAVGKIHYPIATAL